MSAFNLLDTGFLIREGSSAGQVVVFIAPTPDGPFRRCGELALTTAEAKELQQLLSITTRRTDTNDSNNG